MCLTAFARHRSFHFAVRELGCVSGIVITASHNPREYNGYKVYWEDGAQITPPHDKNILAEVAKVTSFTQVKTMAKEDAVKAGLFVTIGKEIDDRYMEELKKQSIHPEIIKEMAKDIKIVYTPLHGTGNLPVRRVLKELGFENVYVVKEQELPDGNFPTVAYPNPEAPKAFELALEACKRSGCRHRACDRSGCRPSWRILQRHKDRRVCELSPEICPECSSQSIF